MVALAPSPHPEARFRTPRSIAPALRILSLATVTALAFGMANSSPAQAATLRPVIDGSARFQVISPTLVRMEYAQDRKFENRTTINVQYRPLKTPYQTWAKDGYRYIKTSKLTLRYKQGSGHFTPQNVSVTLRVAGQTTTAHPRWDVQGDNLVVPHNQLGGWRRDLRDVGGTVKLNPGILSRDGWQLVNDTRTALWKPDSWPIPRAPRIRKDSTFYQDGYFFGYGHNYKQGLRDLATITGPSPVLPEWAFGNWYSNYHAFTRDDYAALMRNFHTRKVPLDVLVVDTDYKAPNQWNGWNWNKKLWPDPQGEIRWLKSMGLTLSFNTHDGMNSNDPKYAIVQKAVHNTLAPNGPKYWDPFSLSYGFDMSRPDHAKWYFWLHEDFEKAGTDFFWFDYGSAKTREEGYPLEKGLVNPLPSTGINGVTMPGLNAEQWQTYLYADRLRKQGKRGFSLSRHRGQLGERRNNVHFTGDTLTTWGTMAFEAEFTAAEGASMGLPYVSHDIGGFKLGNVLTNDMYVRWAQLGVFQPINRPHGLQAKRLPWEYSPAAEKAGVHFLKLRDELVPYLYNLAWEAHLTGVPMARALYLNYPEDPQAYLHNTQYLLGDDMLVAPVAKSGRTATTEVYFPAGTWRDYFTGKVYRGPATHSITTDWMTMPVFVREGGIVTTLAEQSTREGKNWKQSRKNLVGLQVNANVVGARNSTTIYQDDGQSLDYWQGKVARTPVSVRTVRQGRDKVATVTVGRTTGSFRGQSATRDYAFQVYFDHPRKVALKGRTLQAGTYEQARRQPGRYYYYDPLRRTVFVCAAGVANPTESQLVLWG